MSSAPGGGDGGEVFDVVVVGSGPAGSSAAAVAARCGARTLLVERAELPRYKTCGGGLIGISSSLVGDLDDVPPADRIDRVDFTLRGRRRRSRVSREAVMLMVNRTDLDLHLARRAETVGALLRTGTKVTGLRELCSGLVEVHTSDGTVRARVVVGADGASGRTAAHVGVDYAITDLGLEVELEAGDQREHWHGRVHLDWGPLPGSYAWLFPKGDVLTVGVIAERGDPDRTRAYLEDFRSRLGLEHLPVVRSSGHLTRCRRDGSPLRRGRVLVAGDAAGLLEPWTREGISFALRSGLLAGRRAAEAARAVDDTAAESALASYAADVERTLVPEMTAGLLCRRAFSAHPGVFHLIVGSTRSGWRFFGRFTRGETTLESVVRRRVLRLPLRLLQLRSLRAGTR